MPPEKSADMSTAKNSVSSIQYRPATKFAERANIRAKRFRKKSETGSSGADAGNPPPAGCARTGCGGEDWPKFPFGSARSSRSPLLISNEVTRQNEAREPVRQCSFPGTRVSPEQHKLLNRFSMR